MKSRNRRNERNAKKRFIKERNLLSFLTAGFQTIYIIAIFGLLFAAYMKGGEDMTVCLHMNKLGEGVLETLWITPFILSLSILATVSRARRLIRGNGR
jgi:hypothetical protein